MTSANDIQHGGDHYRSALQHWDLCVNYRISYLEAAATKYVTRHRKKAGRLDLDKADHYTAKALELATPADIQVGDVYANLSKGVPIHVVQAFAQANGLTALETLVVDTLFNWQTIRDLEIARERIAELKEVYRVSRGLLKQRP